MTGTRSRMRERLAEHDIAIRGNAGTTVLEGLPSEMPIVEGKNVITFRHGDYASTWILNAAPLPETDRGLFLKGRPNLSNRGHDSGRTFIRNHVAAVWNNKLLSSRGKAGLLGL